MNKGVVNECGVVTVPLAHHVKDVARDLFLAVRHCMCSGKSQVGSPRYDGTYFPCPRSSTGLAYAQVMHHVYDTNKLPLISRSGEDVEERGGMSGRKT